MSSPQDCHSKSLTSRACMTEGKMSALLNDIDLVDRILARCCASTTVLAVSAQAPVRRTLYDVTTLFRLMALLRATDRA
jgi:hypothetical protein